MTNGKSISAERPGSHRGVQAIESALRDLHEALLKLQREADDLADARERAISDAMSALGSEAVWLDEDSNIELTWEGGDEEFGQRLLSDPEKIEDLIEEFLETGVARAGLPTTVRRADSNTGEIQEWDVGESLRATREEFLRTRAAWAPDARAAQALVDETWDRVVQLIRAWVTEPPKTATEDWGRVLQGWRRALGLTGNRAAEVLGVSPPAVTRYEKGTRSPSIAYVESMAERIIGHGAEPPEEAAALFRLESMWDTSATEIMEPFESRHASEHDVREEFGSVVDSLSIDHVRLLLAIVKDRDALAALHAIPTRDELAPLRTALANVVVEGD